MPGFSERITLKPFFRHRSVLMVNLLWLLLLAQSSFAFQQKVSMHRVLDLDLSAKRISILRSSTLGNEEDMEPEDQPDQTALPQNNIVSENSLVNKLLDGMPFSALFQRDGYKKLPPLQVEDLNILFYDVFLLINLSLSISFWVKYRLNFAFLPAAFNEGCLFSILWIISGLYHGAFLMSAIDGHYGSTDERSGPKAAAALALNTYINATNLRLLVALASAVIQHRQVGVSPIEELIPLEIGCGIVLMTFWRALHSYVTPRI